jgi:hypothetical protein
MGRNWPITTRQRGVRCKLQSGRSQAPSSGYAVRNTGAGGCDGRISANAT